VLSSATITLRRALPVVASCGLHGLVVTSVLALGSVWGASEPRVLFAELIPLEAPPPPPIPLPPQPAPRPIPQKMVPPRLVKAPEQPLPVAAEPPPTAKEAVAPPPPPSEPVVPPPPQAAVAAPDPPFVASPTPSSGSGPTTSAEASGGGALVAPGPMTDSGTLPSGGATGGGGSSGGGARARVSPGSGDGITRTARPSGGYQVRPPYPPSARRAGAQGTTLLRVYVAHDGKVGEIVVQESAGHLDLDRAATDAVTRWRFEPARRGTEAVGMWVLLPVQFQLR